MSFILPFLLLAIYYSHSHFLLPSIFPNIQIRDLMRKQYVDQAGNFEITADHIVLSIKHSN